MKVSLKLEDQSPNQTTKNPPIPIHFNAKIPITVFGFPFLSGFNATHHHHSTTAAAAAASDQLSLSLRTHFLSGPSLKLSYNTPTTTTTTTTSATTTTTTTAPLTLTLKSGISLSGSPNNSPLIISANFSFSPQNPNPNPSFLIQFKPKLGSFSLRKSVSSVVSNGRNMKDNGGGGSENGNGNEYGFVPLDRPINWKDLRVESATKDSILSGILMAADTELPLTNRVKVNLRWGVGIPSDYEKQMPYLRVNKIKVERIDVNEEEGDRNVGNEGGSGVLGEFEMLKGMYAWMNRELSDLQKENREMRRALDELKEMKSWKSLRTQNGYSGGGGKRTVPVPVPVPVVENSDGFEQWRMKRNAPGGEAHGQREVKKNGATTASDVESELERAIKAAASSS